MSIVSYPSHSDFSSESYCFSELLPKICLFCTLLMTSRIKVYTFKVGKFVGRFEVSISFYLCVSNLVPIGENSIEIQ